MVSLTLCINVGPDDNLYPIPALCIQNVHGLVLEFTRRSHLGTDILLAGGVFLSDRLPLHSTGQVKGQYRKGNLIAQFGPDIALPDLRHEIAKYDRRGSDA